MLATSTTPGSAAAIASSSRDRLGRLDEHRVDADVCGGLRPRQRLVEPDGGACVGAGGDVQVGAAVDRGAQLREPVVTRHDLLAGHVSAPLGPHLVLEEDARPRPPASQSSTVRTTFSGLP